MVDDLVRLSTAKWSKKSVMSFARITSLESKSGCADAQWDKKEKTMDGLTQRLLRRL